MTVLKPGTQLRSAVCTTAVVIVRAPQDDVVVECGGAAMLGPGETAPDGVQLDPDAADGTVLGKRYADETVGIELLCTKAGPGTVACNGAPLPLKDAKPLPSSD